MWKLITEMDLDSGENYRGFRYQEVANGKVVRDFILPESVALNLMKDLIKSFPQVVEALIQEVNGEMAPEEPEEPQMPRYIPPTASAPPQEEVPSTPLHLPLSRQTEGHAFTLADLAPIERDAPQG